MILTKDALKKSFAAMGVKKGSMALAHSSFKSLGPVEGGPRTAIDALLELVGAEGTVLFPTYDFHVWTETHYFDIRHTPGTMGILGEMARTLPTFKRTRHPIYSWAVAGRLRDTLAEIDTESSYGAGSVFDAIHRENAVMLSLGLTWNHTFTLTHHAEKMSGACDYRYDKPFSGIYVGWDGVPGLRTYSMMVRDLVKGVKTDIGPAMTEMVASGAIREHQVGEALCHASYGKDFFEAITTIVKHAPEKLHTKTR